MGRRYMITVTLREILNCMTVFNELSQKELPAKVAFATARISEQLSSEYSMFEKTRDKIFQKYCEYDENGNLKMGENNEIVVKNGDEAAFNQEVTDLLDTKVEINASPIALDSLGELNFKPAQMLAMKSFIEE